MKPTNGTIYGSKDRLKFKIWDNEKNEWYKPTYEAYNGKVEDLSLSPSGELSMRTINEFAHESVFPYRFEVVMEAPKVVVPKFVADWIESFTDITSSYSILEAFMCSYNKIVLPSELYNYYDNNENGARDKVISAILSGYEVENEPLYHVVNKDGGLMLFNKCDGVVGATPSPASLTKENYGHKPYYQLTEKEIKNYDERYWPFAVPAND